MRNVTFVNCEPVSPTVVVPSRLPLTPRPQLGPQICDDRIILITAVIMGDDKRQNRGRGKHTMVCCRQIVKRGPRGKTMYHDLKEYTGHVDDTNEQRRWRMWSRPCCWSARRSV